MGGCNGIVTLNRGGVEGKGVEEEGEKKFVMVGCIDFCVLVTGPDFDFLWVYLCLAVGWGKVVRPCFGFRGKR